MLLIAISLVCLAIAHTSGATPRALTEPRTSFSAERALLDVRHIAASPHPIGTAAHTEVREYLLGRLRSLGLQPQVQTAFGVQTSKVQGDAIGFVHNIVAKIPGQEPGKALLLSAHYDTVPTSPGAADDGAGVAAILETVRALQTDARLRNSVIILLTDGEEHATLGAAAFVDHHPWMQDVGLALNFDFRGNSGPVYMFETSRGNGRLIEGLAAAERPIGSSLAIEVRRLLPNGTDLTNFMRAGVPSMNFAAVESPRNYHAATDTPEQLDRRTLQHVGDMMLSVSKHFGNVPLENLEAEDRIFFDIPGGLIVYSKAWVLPLTLLVAVALGLGLWIGIRRRRLRIGRTLTGMLLFVVALTLLGGGAQLLWHCASMVHRTYGVLLAEHNSFWYLLAVVAFGIAFFASIPRMATRLVGAEEFAFGAMLCITLLLVASTLWLPGVSFVLAWPLLALGIAQLTALYLDGRGTRERAIVWVLLAGAVPGIVLFTPLLRSLFFALGPKSLFVPAVALALLLGPMTPLLARLNHRWLLPTVPFTLAIVCIAVASATAHFNAISPRANELFYVLDGTTQKAYWISGDKQLDAWNASWFADVSAPRKVPELFGPQSRSWWIHEAPRSNIPAPQIVLLEDKALGNERYLRVQVSSLRAAPRIQIALEGAPVRSSVVQGQLYPRAPREHWVFSAYAMPTHTVEIEFHVPPRTPLHIRAIDYTYGLDAVGVGPRPKSFMSYPFGTSDTVQAVSVLPISS